MFYVKHESENCTIKSTITGENVFTICPVCKAEHQVDLTEIPDLCLYSTVVYCAECSERRTAHSCAEGR